MEVTCPVSVATNVFLSWFCCCWFFHLAKGIWSVTSVEIKDPVETAFTSLFSLTPAIIVLQLPQLIYSLISVLHWGVREESGAVVLQQCGSDLSIEHVSCCSLKHYCWTTSFFMCVALVNMDMSNAESSFGGKGLEVCYSSAKCDLRTERLFHNIYSN